MKANQGFREDIKGYIAINELLKVRVADDVKSATYRSRIEDLSEGKLIIAWPTHGGMRMVVRRDQILDFSFTRDAVPHEFSGLVDEMNTAPLPLLTIIPSSAITRVQRRQNFRVMCLIPVEIAGSVANPHSKPATPLVIHTITNDLSASGMSIRYSKPIPENTLVDVKLSLPDKAPTIRIPCRVMYCDSPPGKQTLYRTGLRYLAISESERARIVRFVYRTQLKGLHP